MASGRGRETEKTSDSECEGEGDQREKKQDRKAHRVLSGTGRSCSECASTRNRKCSVTALQVFAIASAATATDHNRKSCRRVTRPLVNSSCRRKMWRGTLFIVRTSPKPSTVSFRFEGSKERSRHELHFHSCTDPLIFLSISQLS